MGSTRDALDHGAAQIAVSKSRIAETAEQIATLQERSLLTMDAIEGSRRLLEQVRPFPWHR